jgi:hypothetical protein
MKVNNASASRRTSWGTTINVRPESNCASCFTDESKDNDALTLTRVQVG